MIQDGLASNPPRFQVGQEIDVLYESGNPQKARINKWMNLYFAPLLLGGMGLIFDDYYFFRSTFEDENIFPRTVMFVNQASDPIVERVLVPDMVLKIAERTVRRRLAYAKAWLFRELTKGDSRLYVGGNDGL